MFGQAPSMDDLPMQPVAEIGRDDDVIFRRHFRDEYVQLALQVDVSGSSFMK